MLELGSSRRAHRPAIDSGRRDAYEEQSVEAPVPALQSAVTNLFFRELHMTYFPSGRE
jgi:hypothetical protein